MNDAPATQPLTQLLGLARRSRQAKSAQELAFLAVNDTHAIVSYRQAALWLPTGTHTLSGVVQIEANAPYVQFLNRLCPSLAGKDPGPITKADVSPALAAEWDEWLPSYAFWLPVKSVGGIIFARDLPWTELEKALFAEWGGTWGYAWQYHHRESGWSPATWRAKLAGFWSQPQNPWWKRRAFYVSLALAAVLLCPVRLSVLAPGELVPSHPAVIRSPLEGVVAQFAVEPNQAVKSGEVLFSIDAAPLKTKLQMAQDTLSTAEAEYRQNSQLAVTDEKAKIQLAALKGKIDTARTEVEFLQGELAKTDVAAPRDGIALFDDPSEWIGKPLAVGERIMRLSTPGDAEVEAWIAVGDAIPLEQGAPVQLYLNASPLSAVDAHIRYVAFDAVQRPDGTFAYRLRATLDQPTEHRVGLKGTARVSGRWVPLGYWILRRPLATIRKTIGW